MSIKKGSELGGYRTMVELSKELKINKSKLHYYVLVGLIHPKGKFSQTTVFDQEEVKTRLAEVAEIKKKTGMTLQEISEDFKKKNK